MEIKKIVTASEFDKRTEEWRKLNTYQFGPLSNLDTNENALVTVAEVNGESVAYLIADGRSLWHIETKTGHTGNGYAKKLAKAAKINFAYEVCSDSGAAFCESLGIEFDDCRE